MEWQDIATADLNPKLARELVWCTNCGSVERVNAGQCISVGWPKCCGYTMTIDAPSERPAMSPSLPPNEGE